MLQHPASSGTTNGADVASVVAACNQFAIDAYRAFAEQTSKDFCFGPSGMFCALAMTAAGAGGVTASEIAKVLHVAGLEAQLHPALRALREQLALAPVEIRMANRLWGQRGYHFLPPFLETTESCYGARLAEVVFSAPQEAQREINAWVSQQTNGKVPTILPADVLDSLTRLVLTNAVHFLASWLDTFPADATARAPFRTINGGQTFVHMMQQTNDFAYGESDDLQVLEMPYAPRTFDGGWVPFTMCVILPRAYDGLASVEAGLSLDSFHRLDSLVGQRVNVRLPRFRSKSAFDLKATLTALGMPTAFSQAAADFSRMTDDPEGLYIAAALHQTFVDVNERGTEAAAATAFLIAMGGMHSQTPVDFHADRPFLYLIRDRRNGLVHFMGRVATAEAAGAT